MPKTPTKPEETFGIKSSQYFNGDEVRAIIKGFKEEIQRLKDEIKVLQRECLTKIKENHNLIVEMGFDIETQAQQELWDYMIKISVFGCLDEDRMKVIKKKFNLK